jgi:ligand-binding sensor domain-containing protein
MRKLIWAASAIIVYLLLSSSKPLSISLSLSRSSIAMERCAVRPGAVWRSWQIIQEPITPVYALLVNRNILWVGTSRGVWRIDLENGDSTSYKEMGSTPRLLPVDEDRLWAATERGLAFWDGKQWSVPPGRLGGGELLGIDYQGDLWTQAYPGYSGYIVHGQYPGHLPPASGLWEPQAGAAFDIREPIDCQRWRAVTTGSYTHRSSSECQSLQRALQTVRKLTTESVMLALDADQSIWWANQVKLVHLTGGRITTFALPPHQLHALAADPAHGVWLGTDQGLIYSDGSTLRWVSLSLEACTIPTPTDIAIDSKGIAWAAAFKALLTLADETNWQLVSDLGLADGYGVPTSSKYAIAAAPDGGMWAQGGVLRRFRDAIELPAVRTPQLQCGNDMPQMQVDDTGNIWQARGKCGIWQFTPSAEGGRWTVHFPGGRIESIAPSMDGSIYAAGDQGLFAFTGETYPDPSSMLGFAWRPLAIDLPRDLVLAADRNKGVWLGSPQTGELWNYRAGQTAPFGQPFERGILQQLYVDGHNRLWANLQNTLAVYDGKTWKHISSPAGTIRKLTGGPDDRIWVLGTEAVAVYDPAKDKRP